MKKARTAPQPTTHQALFEQLFTITDFETLEDIIQDAFIFRIASDDFRNDFTHTRRVAMMRVHAQLIEGLNMAHKEVCHA